MANGLGHGLRVGDNIELSAGIGHEETHGAFGNAENGGNFPIALAGRRPGENLGFATCEARIARVQPPVMAAFSSMPA